MKKLIFIFSLLLSAAASAQNATLQDGSYLKKLSMHVRGYPPAPAEYAELKTAQKAKTVDAFIEKKVTEYLASNEHSLKLSLKLEELFRIKTNLSLPDVSPMYDSDGLKANALNTLFLRLAKENLSWDTLLTGKEYSLSTGRVWGGMADVTFLRAVIPNLPAASGSGSNDVKVVDHKFAATDSRIAGALTTARFFNRYPTTEINKNRKRAAAVFNIFLCDSMAPAIPEPPSSPDGLLDKAFPGSKNTITVQDLQFALASNDKHGTDQACMQCHYKLDPLGMTFMKSNSGLSPSASAGRLTFKETKTGKLVDEPANGLGDLAKAIVKQPQYADCQVQTFWNWYIGEDRPLSSEREQELVKEFNRVGRKTNDFIKILLAAPEFRTREFRTAAQLRAAEVNAVFGKCLKCHSSEGIPDFTKWPIGGTNSEMQRWSQKISNALDLPNGGAKRTMPPTWSGWHPTDEQLQLLKLWFEDGAPDENGDKQI